MESLLPHFRMHWDHEPLRLAKARSGPRVCDQLCSARKTFAAFCLSLPARNERGESRREGELIKSASSPRPSHAFFRRRGRENAAVRAKQVFCRTQLVTNLPYSRLQVCATDLGNRYKPGFT